MKTSKHTNIEDISAIGNELSDEHLRLVSEGAARCGTRPASASNPDEPDTATDNTNANLDSCV